MSGLRELLDGYLATRRALGFKLTAPGKTLDAFVSWMEEAGEPTIRRDLAAAWVSQFSRGTVPERLNHIRQFAEHVVWFDPATEVPAPDHHPLHAAESRRRDRMARGTSGGRRHDRRGGHARIERPRRRAP